MGHGLAHATLKSLGSDDSGDGGGAASRTSDSLFLWMTKKFASQPARQAKGIEHSVWLVNFCHLYLHFISFIKVCKSLDRRTKITLLNFHPSPLSFVLPSFQSSTMFWFISIEWNLFSEISWSLAQLINDQNRSSAVDTSWFMSPNLSNHRIYYQTVLWWLKINRRALTLRPTLMSI